MNFFKKLPINKISTDLAAPAGFSAGVDFVDLRRFVEARYLERVLEFFLTSTEIEKAPRGKKIFQFAASRFAAKEAVVKVLPEGATYMDFEICKKGNKPGVNFLNPRFSNIQIAVSISHERDTAVAFAIAKNI